MEPRPIGFVEPVGYRVYEHPRAVAQSSATAGGRAVAHSSAGGTFY